MKLTTPPTAFVAVKKKWTLAVLVIATVLTTTAFATSQEETTSVLRFVEGDDYVRLAEGETARVGGFLFAPEAVDRIIDGREWFVTRVEIRDARIAALEEEVEHLRAALTFADQIASTKDDQISSLRSSMRWASLEKWVFLAGGIAVAAVALSNE